MNFAMVAGAGAGFMLGGIPGALAGLLAGHVLGLLSVGAGGVNVVTSEVDASQRANDSFLEQHVNEQVFGDKFGA